MQAGDCVVFGEYGWHVLDVQGGNALLLSDKVLEHRLYNDKHGDTTWENCTLRGYLNGPFYDKFTVEEKSRIVKTAISNPDNPWYRTNGGNNTHDKIFLLNLEDVAQYWGDSGQLMTRPKNDGRFSWWQDEYAFWIDDQYNAARKVGNYAGTALWWWLRSPGNSSTYAAFVDYNGHINLHGNTVYVHACGIRPALWLMR